MTACPPERRRTRSTTSRTRRRREREPSAGAVAAETSPSASTRGRAPPESPPGPARDSAHPSHPGERREPMPATDAPRRPKTAERGAPRAPPPGTALAAPHLPLGAARARRPPSARSSPPSPTSWSTVRTTVRGHPRGDRPRRDQRPDAAARRSPGGDPARPARLDDVRVQDCRPPSLATPSPSGSTTVTPMPPRTQIPARCSRGSSETATS